jgi:hypothetical protein
VTVAAAVKVIHTETFTAPRQKRGLFPAELGEDLRKVFHAEIKYSYCLNITWTARAKFPSFCLGSLDEEICCGGIWEEEFQK